MLIEGGAIPARDRRHLVFSEPVERLNEPGEIDEVVPGAGEFLRPARAPSERMIR